LALLGFTWSRDRALAPPKPEEHEAARGVVVAGRWSLPRSLPGLARLRAGLRGLPTGAAPSPHPLAVAAIRADPEPWLPFRALTCCPGRTFVDLLSWDSPVLAPRSSRSEDRSVERPRLSPRPETGTPPPSTDPAERPLPRAFPPASAPERPSLQLVPSSWFRTTSTVSSARRSRACCVPLPVMGFAAFRTTPAPSPTIGEPIGGGRRSCRPRSAFHTPRRNPRRQPHHVTVAVAPLPLAAVPARPSDVHRYR
jgi:hypothetical protein